jgi:hypothetical protein
MDSSQANSREYQRQAIDAEIKSLEDSIRALRHRRNALAPISSLPPEVITVIFSESLVPRRVTVSDSITGKKSDPLAWLRVSHVCQQWRNIVLNQPVFWSRVDFTNISSAGVAEILARAKMVPLHLEARGLGDYWDDEQFSVFQEELQLRVSHIRHLIISANHWRLDKIVKGFVSPASTLESLSLSSKDKWRSIAIPETLFGGAMPKLSCLELSNCDISWESSLLKGLRYLEIRSLSTDMRPSLSVWLDALEEMWQLRTLTLHSASPIAPPIPIEVERTVTLPSLTHLDIFSSAKNCALALAHFDLPVLTSLCVEAIVHFPHGNDVQNLLPYVMRHAHGPQDTQTLQSALILDKHKYIDVLAWVTPDIDVEAHDLLTLLPTTLPTRVALSLTSKARGWYACDTRIETISTVIAALPLDDLVTLILKDSTSTELGKEVWLPSSPKWHLLQRVRLTFQMDQFVDWLLADKGGCENPLLPSLKELVLVECRLNKIRTLSLCDALKKRLEQGVPLEMLDLRTCDPNRDYYYPAAVQMLSEIVVDVMGPEKAFEARSRISTWDGLTCGPFVGHENSDSDDSDTNPDEDYEE